MSDDIELLTTEQAADFLGLSPRTLEDWRYKGGGPRYKKVGRSVRYVKAELIEWVQEGTREHTSQEADPSVALGRR